MKISGGLTQDEIVVGNVYNKYAARNPLVRLIMRRFLRTVDDFVAKAEPASIHEIGCGEGFLTLRLKQHGYNARGSDFSEKVIGIAKENAAALGVAPSIFKSRSVYDVTLEDAADLLVCCEVLEHLENPSEALRALQSLAPKFVIVSVPREPIWRILNVMRGKYIGAWGNSPGHIQHWSRKDFLNLLQSFFSIVEVQTPLPWTMVLCSAKNAGE